MFPRETAPGYYDLLLATCRRAGFTPRVFHEPGSIQTNLGLVSAGIGVTLMPASIRSLGRSGVVYRPLAPPVPHVEMGVAYRHGARSPVLLAFLQVLREATAGIRPGPPSPRPRSESAPRSR
jgi:DNA-binding transcriptional LysR family regulator